MDARPADKGDNRFDLKAWLSRIFHRKSKVTIEELYQELRHCSKNQLIRELVEQAQLINSHNRCGVTSKFKKEMKLFSKKKLIKAVILLRIQNTNKYKKLIKNVRGNLNENTTQRSGA